LSADPLAHYKKIIAACVYPDLIRNKPIQIAKAKKAISDYSKAVGDPLGEAELMTFFVEQGTSLTCDIGDLGGGFYAAMVLMFGRAAERIRQLPEPQREAFQERLQAIIQAASPIGWFYPDELRDHYNRVF